MFFKINDPKNYVICSEFPFCELLQRFQDRQTEWMAGLRYQDHNIPVHIRREFRRGKLAVKINTNSKEEAPGLLGQE